MESTFKSLETSRMPGQQPATRSIHSTRSIHWSMCVRLLSAGTKKE